MLTLVLRINRAYILKKYKVVFCLICKILFINFLQLDGKHAGASVQEDENESQYHKLNWWIAPII